MKKYIQILSLALLFSSFSLSVQGQTKVITQKTEKNNHTQKKADGKKVRKTPKKSNVSSSSILSSKKETVIQNLVNNMVFVEGGTFMMGATPEQGTDIGEDEKPTHRVMVSSFSIGKYEVTQEEWYAVMGSNPSHFKGSKHPVEQVSWNDCQIFIEKLNKITGIQFRLPTEAEWEYAARGGKYSRGYKYAGGNNLDLIAWYSENSGEGTQAVGQKQANELGLFDMAGNVWEWCSDSKADYASSIPKQNSDNRVNRGGGWRSGATLCRVSFRFDDGIDDSFKTLGFRLAI